MSGNLEYLNSLILKQKKLKHGKILKVAAKTDDLIEELKAISKNGWVNFDIKARRQVSEKGVSHYAQVDNFDPSESPSGRDSSKNGGASENSRGEEDEDDLPF